MKKKFLKVAGILMALAATGLANYPIDDLLGRIKCC